MTGVQTCALPISAGEMPAMEPAPEIVPPTEEPAEVPAAALGRAKR